MELSPFQLLASVGVLLAILEMFTASFSLLPAGVAFLATGLWGLVTKNWVTLLSLLALHLLVTYTISYRYVWPRVRKSVPKTPATGMIGQIATVTEAINGATAPGYVKLYGDSWRAVSNESLDVGAQVTILRLDGNKVIVSSVKA